MKKRRIIQVLDPPKIKSSIGYVVKQNLEGEFNSISLSLQFDFIKACDLNLISIKVNYFYYFVKLNVDRENKALLQLTDFLLIVCTVNLEVLYQNIQRVYSSTIIVNHFE